MTGTRQIHATNTAAIVWPNHDGGVITPQLVAATACRRSCAIGSAVGTAGHTVAVSFHPGRTGAIPVHTDITLVTFMAFTPIMCASMFSTTMVRP